MTDRTISILVALDKNYRIDDIEYITNAIKMIKGVSETKINIFDCESDMNKWASEQEFKRKIVKFLINEIESIK